MIDTLTIAHDLKKAGVDWDHAKAHAKAIADSTEKQYQDLATKDFVTSQIQTVRTEISDLRGDMNTMEGNLRGDMSTMEGNLRGEISTMEGNLRGEMSTMEGNLRGDISDLRGDISDLRGDMNTMGSDLRGEMKTMEARILRWAIATALTVGSGLFAALRLSLG